MGTYGVIAFHLTFELIYLLAFPILILAGNFQNV